MRLFTLPLTSRKKPRVTAPVLDGEPHRGARTACESPTARDAARDASTRSAATHETAPAARGIPAARSTAAAREAAPAAPAAAAAHSPSHWSAPSSHGASLSPSTFNGALLPICGIEVLIVVVRPWVLANIHEANLFVVAFQERFRRTIVLVTQRADGAARFYGPVDIVRVLQALPLELIPWRRILLHATPPPSWRLPIPQPQPHPHSAMPAGSAEITKVLPTHHRAGSR